MNASTPRRILYYCQSLLGVGHIACSMRIIEELLPHCEVDLIQGGLEAARMLEHPNLRRLKQTNLLHDHATHELFDPLGARTVDEIWLEREKEIAAFLRGRYDAIVVEFYPFGRRRLKREIVNLFNAVRASSGPIPIFCAVREVLVPGTPEQERRIVQTIRKYIHTVFVRGDPNVIRFDETFACTPEIEDRLVYTGYVGAQLPARRPPRKKQILVSQGGGSIGPELIDGAIQAAALMPDYRFVLVMGARTTPQQRAGVRERVRNANVDVVPFLADFQQHMMESAVSISLGGDNTLSDLLTARTPGLAYPYQGNSEQRFRIRKFVEKGLLLELSAQDLEGPRLKAMIERALALPAAQRDVAVDGARVTAEKIRGLLQPREMVGHAGPLAASV